MFIGKKKLVNHFLGMANTEKSSSGPVSRKLLQLTEKRHITEGE